MMQKLFISQPMKGKTEEEIKREREDALKFAKEVLQEDVELIGGELVKLESCMYDSKEGAAASGFAR